MQLKVGEEYDFEVDRRYFLHNRSHAIGDVIDALVELVTNADDSYDRLFSHQKRSKDGGDILIEHQLKHKPELSSIVVRDQAEGMNVREIAEKLKRIGRYSSEPGNRGWASRGAKDCTELGDLTYESMKDDKYCRFVLRHNGKVKPEVIDARVTKDQRDELGIPHGNGTSVTLRVNAEKRFISYERLASWLPWHYALRDIMGESSDSHVRLRKLGTRDKPTRLVCSPPQGVLVVDMPFGIEDYPGAQARLKIWRAEEPLAAHEGGARFERFGIIIKGKRAIHECSLLADEFKRDANAHRYFGRLDCPYLDELMREYDEQQARDEPHPESNPSVLIDPNRRFGLERGHPFVQKLLVVPSEQLRALLAVDRKDEASRERKVASQETQRRLDQLAKLADKFLREQMEDLEDLEAGEAVEETAFAKQGTLIYPTYTNVGVGRERTLTVYVRKSLLPADSCVRIRTDEPGRLQVLQPDVLLHDHKMKSDRALGSFRVKGLQLGPAVIQASCDGLPIPEAVVEVVDESPHDRSFVNPLEFERDAYTVRVGSQKTLRLYAKCPDVVSQDTYVTVSSSSPGGVTVKGRCELTPVAGCNYAEGYVIIHGRTLQCKATITAEVHGRRAEARVGVIDRPEEHIGSPLTIDLVDRDLGVYRAAFEPNTNKLLVSARHKSLERYLGPEGEGFPGQEAPYFRILLAEIVAEAIARRALLMEAGLRPWDFEFPNLRDADQIADDVLSHLHRRLRDFAAQAHATMVGNQELKSL